MRSSHLLLLVVLLLAGGAAFFFLGGEQSPRGLEGNENGDQSGELQPGDLPAVTEGGGESVGNRTEISEPAVEAAPDTALEPEELAALDANALLGRVVDLEGIGIEGCEIRFLEGGIHRSWTDRRQPGIPAEAPTTVTDALGRFRFEDLEPGETHALRVQHPEIALTFVEGVIVGDFGETQEPPIVLTYGKRLRGTITNEFNLPMPGVLLHLDGGWLPADPRPSFDRMSAVTDSEGKYEILGIPDGVRCLTAVAPGMGNLTRIQSLIFMDKTGQSHTCDMQLKSQDDLAGRVTDLTGKGIAGVELLAVDREAYRDVGNDRALSEADGSFRFEHLPPGKYRITTRLAGYEPVTKENVQTPKDDLNLILGARPVIRGAVVDAANGEGLSKFSLRLLFHQNGVKQIAVPRGTALPINAGADGVFAVPTKKPAGLWRVQADAPGYAPNVSEPFEVQAGKGARDVLIAMTHGGTIRGKLVTAEGEPIVGGRITSRGNDWRDDAFSQAVGDGEGGDATVSSARSGKDGSFVLANLRPATYQLFIRSARFHQVNKRDLSVDEGGDLELGELVMEVGGSMRGLLLDAEDSAIPGGMVFLNPVNQGQGLSVYRGKSDHDGRWEIGNIVPGDYRLTGRAPGGGADMFGVWPSSGGDVVAIAGGSTASRNVRLDDWTMPKPPEPKPPTGYLGGKVLNAAGAELSGVALELRSAANADEVRDTKSGRGGAYTFPMVTPGEWDVSIEGQPDSAVRVTITADQWSYQDLESSQ